MELKGKTFIVTGGDNDIGKELIAILLSKKCKVIAVNFKESTLQQTINNDFLTVLTADITNEKSVELLYEKSLSIYGTIDGIINNAGIIKPFRNLNDLSFETIERIFNINYYGTLYLSKIFLPYLFSRPEANLVLSVGPSLSVSQKATCRNSKVMSSLKMLVEGLRSELLDTTIKVMTVASGIIPASNNQKDSSTIFPSDAALAIINGMEKGSAYIDIARNSTYISRSSLFIHQIIKRIANYRLIKQKNQNQYDVN